MYGQDFYAKMRSWPVEDEWRVPAVAISIGTNTFRARHKNVVNIPSRGLYPLRDLFIASDGKMVLGCDGAGLELRMLAHFMNDSDYIDTVLNGDIHSYNQELAGLPTRDMAKTFIYAL
jgi:DNA polymerase I-like protein with 3'-5' exonuclease and polymerase domains